MELIEPPLCLKLLRELKPEGFQHSMEFAKKILPGELKNPLQPLPPKDLGLLKMGPNSLFHPLNFSYFQRCFSDAGLIISFTEAS